MNNNLYGSLNKNQLHIDKTSSLEKGIVVFPSIYIEGAAASGKTTAVKMLLAKHPEVKHTVIFMDRQNNNLESELSAICKKMQKETIWLIFENVNHPLTKEECSIMKNFVRRMPETGKAIFIGRERPHEELLDLMWKREMELIFQESLLFTKSEVREYLERSNSALKYDEVYELTGGWPGCVDMMVRYPGKNADAGEIRESFEISTYIEKEIIGSLNEEEQKLVHAGRNCPWLAPELCQDMWHMEGTADTFERLKRKGIFYYNKIKKHYKLARLFQNGKDSDSIESWASLANWYEEHRNIREAFLCLKKTGEKDIYREFLLRHYNVLPFLDVNYEDVLNWRQERLEIYYLRGMYHYSHQHFDNLKKEIERIKQWIPSTEEEKHLQTEIYLNLMYINPDISLSEWMEMLENETKNKLKIHLYSMLGTGYSFLCGLRDISGLFACSKKEESRQAKIWKESLEEQEWTAYCLARMDYYMETKREDSIREEDINMFYLALEKNADGTLTKPNSMSRWRFHLAGLYLLCKWPGLGGNLSSPNYIFQLEKQLLKEDVELCRRNTESVVSLYSPWWNEPERLSRWLRYTEEAVKMQISEENYLEMFARAKGYLLLNRYEKAEQILEQLLPYLQAYHRSRYLAESLFGMAIVSWNKGKTGQAIRYMMESFLVTGNSRYVAFYARYGKKGREVLEAYVDWLKQTTPEGWHRKKKYNYGNVLRMPMEDYLEVILRAAKKESKFSMELSKGKNVDRLTMMETIILQDISRGLTNTEICEEQNLKLPTVKSHIYSLYKKLGVNSRVQAVNKGKEMGIVR